MPQRPRVCLLSAHRYGTPCRPARRRAMGVLRAADECSQPSSAGAEDDSARTAESPLSAPVYIRRTQRRHSQGSPGQSRKLTAAARIHGRFGLGGVPSRGHEGSRIWHGRLHRWRTRPADEAMSDGQDVQAEPVARPDRGSRRSAGRRGLRRIICVRVNLDKRFVRCIKSCV